MLQRELEICNQVSQCFPDYYKQSKNIPKAYFGEGKIKAIILGTDPTYLSGEADFQFVFDLGKKDTPFFRGIKKNLLELDIELENLYVQNLVRNYFTKETSKNPIWNKCALLWMDLLKKELDNNFDRSIPIFITAWRILQVIIKQSILKDITPQSIYNEKRFFNENENFFNRKIIAIFRHYKYNLKKWPDYTNKIYKDIF